MKKANKTPEQLEIGIQSSTDPPKKEKRGGRRQNQTGRPSEYMRPHLGHARMERLQALARSQGVTPLQLLEEHIERWLDSSETASQVEAIERWEKFEREEGRQPPKLIRKPKKLAFGRALLRR